MKKKIGLLLTDIHLSKSNILVVKEVFSTADELCVREGIPYIMLLGDLFESRKSQPQEVLNVFGDILKSLQTPVVMIPGNHDKVDYTSERSYLDEFEFHPGVTLFSNYMYKVFEDVETPLYLHFIPFFNEETTYSLYLNQCLEVVNDFKEEYPGSIHILLTHVGVDGVVNNDGEMVHNGLTGKTLAIFDQVLIGHYHNRSEVGQNVLYIGSTHQKNFGEDEYKGFTILYKDGSNEFIKQDFTSYKTFKVDFFLMDSKFVHQLTQEAVQFKALRETNFVRFEFVGSEEALASLDKGSFRSLGFDIKVVSPEITKTVEQLKTIDPIKFTKASLRTEFEEFCEEKGLDFEFGKKYLEKHLETK